MNAHCNDFQFSVLCTCNTHVVYTMSYCVHVHVVLCDMKGGKLSTYVFMN